VNLSEYPLVGRYVYLRPIENRDYEVIQRSELAGTTALLYRHYGTTPSPDHFVSSLWSGVLAQYMICSIHSNAPLGMATCYGADMKNGFAYLAALIFAPYRRQAFVHEGIELFISYLWRAFPFRKLYAETIEPNFSKFSSATDIGWTVEGRLSDHQFVNGQYVDKVILSLTREHWSQRLTASSPRSGLLERVRILENGSSILENRNTT
jgi:RimJ/RimL family protein N-acetyltransferase